ncbi:uncharacterized protein LOC126424627 [Schistocerca serialis cubense]|uniref:uncharacterized protein LOC126424627 n=1 Tax=Schistocerca serialis cubense TaxID=2023355 RepID=UPI00214F26A7|nr:uncharacterized protein LOC126424627 [Schistocerca serialis cubense]
MLRQHNFHHVNSEPTRLQACLDNAFVNCARDMYSTKAQNARAVACVCTPLADSACVRQAGRPLQQQQHSQGHFLRLNYTEKLATRRQRTWCFLSSQRLLQQFFSDAPAADMATYTLPLAAILLLLAVCALAVDPSDLSQCDEADTQEVRPVCAGDGRAIRTFQNRCAVYRYNRVKRTRLRVLSEGDCYNNVRGVQ